MRIAGWCIWLAGDDEESSSLRLKKRLRRRGPMAISLKSLPRRSRIEFAGVQGLQRDHQYQWGSFLRTSLWSTMIIHYHRVHRHLNHDVCHHLHHVKVVLIIIIIIGVDKFIIVIIVISIAIVAIMAAISTSSFCKSSSSPSSAYASQSPSSSLSAACSFIIMLIISIVCAFQNLGTIQFETVIRKHEHVHYIFAFRNYHDAMRGLKIIAARHYLFDKAACIDRSNHGCCW